MAPFYIEKSQWFTCPQSVTRAISNHCHCFLSHVFDVFVLSDIADCPTSRRSGRHIIPPLAWWTTERMVIDPVTSVSKIVCDSPVVKSPEPTDKLSCTPTLKSSDLYWSGPQNKKHLGIRVKREVSLEFSASIVGERTSPSVNIIRLLWVRNQ